MIKTLISGTWVCAVTAAAIYAGAAWKAGQRDNAMPEQAFDLEHRRTKPLNVPMIADGAVQGYIIAQLGYTVDSKLAKKMPVQPEAFITDEAFRSIYGDEKLDFRHLDRYDLGKLTRDVHQRANARMKADLIKDVLVQEFNYLTKTDIGGR